MQFQNVDQGPPLESYYFHGCHNYLVPWLVEPGALRPALGVGILKVADKLGLVDLSDAVARLVRVGPTEVKL